MRDNVQKHKGRIEKLELEVDETEKGKLNTYNNKRLGTVWKWFWAFFIFYRLAEPVPPIQRKQGVFMKITEIKIRQIEGFPRLKAVASITLDISLS